MKEVDADLYDFLNNHETGMCCRDNKIEAWTFINFDDVQDFINIVGTDYFNCGGIECRLQEDNVCIDIIDFIEGKGQLLSSYKNCFDKCDWEQYEKIILESEKD